MSLFFLQHKCERAHGRPGNTPKVQKGLSHPPTAQQTNKNIPVHRLTTATKSRQKYKCHMTQKESHVIQAILSNVLKHKGYIYRRSMSSASYRMEEQLNCYGFRPHTHKNVVTLFGGVATIQNRCRVLYHVTRKKKEEAFQPFSKDAKTVGEKSRSHDNNKKGGKGKFAKVT